MLVFLCRQQPGKLQVQRGRHFEVPLLARGQADADAQLLQGGAVVRPNAVGLDQGGG